MRMLGEGRDGGKDKACERARKWILDHGSAIAISSWGKTWLAVQHMIQFNFILLN
jgi:beta-amyrin synthase